MSATLTTQVLGQDKNGKDLHGGDKVLYEGEEVSIWGWTNPHKQDEPVKLVIKGEEVHPSKVIKI